MRVARAAACSASRASSRRSRASRCSRSWCRRSRWRVARSPRLEVQHRLPAGVHRADALQRAADPAQHRDRHRAASTRRCVEAARGVGMTPRQQLVRVELPLAMPVIIAGVRTSTVWTVGIATLSTPVGATSLGNYIFSGLQTRNFDAVLVGCVAAARCSRCALDGLVRALETGVARAAARRSSSPRSRALGAALRVYTGGAFARGGSAARPDADRDRREDLHRAVHPERDPRGRVARRTRHPADTVCRRSARRSRSTRSRRRRSTSTSTTRARSGPPCMHRDGRRRTARRVLREVEPLPARARTASSLVGALGFENAYALAMRRDARARSASARLSDLAPRAPRALDRRRLRVLRPPRVDGARARRTACASRRSAAWTRR